MVFLVERKVSSSLQSFLFQSFATSTVKVRNGHFWTILNKLRVFLIFKSLNESFFWTQFVRKCFPKYLETINVLIFQKCFKLRIKLLFLYIELRSYMI